MGTGPTVWEQKRRNVECPECGVEVAAGLLMMYHQSQHVVGQGDRGAPPRPPRGGPNLLGIFPKFFIAAPVSGRGVPGRGFKSDQPPGSLCAPPQAGNNRDPGGREPTLPQVPQV